MNDLSRVMTKKEWQAEAFRLQAELQKQDQEIERLKQAWGGAEMLRTEDADTRGQREVELTEANELLDQTIEVLGDLQTWMVCYPHLYSLATEKWWNLRAKPLLDKLQALKKEGTE